MDCTARILEILVVSMSKGEAIELSYYLGDANMKDFQNTSNTANFYMVPLSINKVNNSIKLLNTTIVQ